MSFRVLFALPLTLALLDGSRDELELAPGKGLVLVKTFEVTSDSGSTTEADMGDSDSTKESEIWNW